ncbi:MAG: hypothetical protein OSA51_00840 [Octadecabacter sp.]|nr:hypothetical protein [Octadecabacter sp.]
MKRPSIACKTKKQLSHLIILIIFLCPLLKLNKTKILAYGAPKGCHISEPQIEDATNDRLMSESDVHMQKPAGSCHRDAISKLKAAAATKQAARKVGQSGNHDRVNKKRALK